MDAGSTRAIRKWEIATIGGFKSVLSLPAARAKKSFAQLSTALDAIAEVSITDPAALWRIATRLVAFGEKVEAATSKENREKINKAIDDLVKVL